MGSVRMISTLERAPSAPVAIEPLDISAEHKGGRICG
jgi:hypothetical protein